MNLIKIDNHNGLPADWQCLELAGYTTVEAAAARVASITGREPETVYELAAQGKFPARWFFPVRQVEVMG